MSASGATHADAELILRLYDLRREPVLRAAREWFASRFFPESLDDVLACFSPAFPENAYLRMVASYWEMAASLVVHGPLDAELFMQSAGEMLLCWAKLEAYVPEVRERAGGQFLNNVEEAIRRVSWASDRVRQLREWLPAYQLALRSRAVP